MSVSPTDDCGRRPKAQYGRDDVRKKVRPHGKPYQVRTFARDGCHSPHGRIVEMDQQKPPMYEDDLEAVNHVQTLVKELRDYDMGDDTDAPTAMLTGLDNFLPHLRDYVESEVKDGEPE